MAEVYIIIETALFSPLAADYWTADERGAFATWLSGNAKAGDVTPGVKSVKSAGHVQVVANVVVSGLFISTNFPTEKSGCC